VAFTNHDTLSGIVYARSLSQRYQVEVIGGIEVSAWDKAADTKAHILGLGFSSEIAPSITQLCAPLLERRRRNTLWQMEQLERHGISFDRAMVEAQAQKSTCVYKQHIMAALTSAPFGSEEYLQLYRLLFKNGGICDRDIEYVDACAAVEAIKADGGLAVLAHPGQFDNYSLVPRLAAVGLDGIEVYHPDHNALDESKAAQLAADYQLLKTGGSDYHGSFGKSPHPGFRRLVSDSDIFGEQCPC
jgi:predicted metal-dependent phosphoesterase TrpH